MVPDQRLYPSGPDFCSINYQARPCKLFQQCKTCFAYFIVKLLMYSFSAGWFFSGSLIPCFIFLLLFITIEHELFRDFLLLSVPRFQSPLFHSVCSLNNYRSFFYNKLFPTCYQSTFLSAFGSAFKVISAILIIKRKIWLNGFSSHS